MRHLSFVCVCDRVQKLNLTAAFRVAPVEKYTLTVIIDGEEQTFDGDSLLNGTGRAPNVHDIGLSSAGIKFDGKQGILVDEFYRACSRTVVTSALEPTDTKSCLTITNCCSCNPENYFHYNVSKWILLQKRRTRMSTHVVM